MVTSLPYGRKVFKKKAPKSKKKLDVQASETNEAIETYLKSIPKSRYNGKTI